MTMTEVTKNQSLVEELIQELGQDLRHFEDASEQESHPEGHFLHE